MPEPNEIEGGKRSAWMAHVKKTMRANKGKSLSAVLKMASKTFKKTRKGGGAGSGGPGASTAQPLGGMDGGARRKRGASRKSRGSRGSRKH